MARINNAIDTREKAAVIYVDIDHFKAYNDVYGFEAGDRAIIFTAETLERNLVSTKAESGFLGHVGGDDFIVVIPRESAEEYANTVCKEFDEKAEDLYNEADRNRGGIRAKDRQGISREFAFMSVSMAGVDLSLSRFDHFSEVASAAASVKKAAKGKEGSSFVMDRRQGPPVGYERDDTA
jgi:diguanylate cyclase (GGDEF)-like protein